MKLIEKGFIQLSLSTVVTAVILSLLGLSFYLSDSSSKGKVMIVLTESGFSPNEVTIQAGQVVRFATIRAKPFRPASNLHPLHDLYPEFDPQRPIEPNEAWDFRFEKIGQWEYHDHLHPDFTGVIAVIDEGGANLKSADKSCAELYLGKITSRASMRCWKETVMQVVSSEGLSKALAMLGEEYRRDHSFSEKCHLLSHLIGREAYKQFSAGSEIKIGRDVSQCGYGFYHGFMEELVDLGGGIGQARKFCDSFESQLKYKNTDETSDCYHGLGHGITEKYYESMPENSQKIIDEAVRQCQKPEIGEVGIRSCILGVFGVIFSHIDYNKSPDKGNSISLCSKQKESYKESCINAVIRHAPPWFVGQNYLELANFIEGFESVEGAKRAMRLLSVFHAYGSYDALSSKGYSEIVSSCRSFMTNFQLPCIVGYAEGIARILSDSNKGYPEVVKFCQTKGLTEEEKTACLKPFD